MLLIETIVPNAPELLRYELRTNQQGFLTRARRGAPRHLVLCRGASTGRVRVVEAEREAAGEGEDEEHVLEDSRRSSAANGADESDSSASPDES